MIDLARVKIWGIEVGAVGWDPAREIGVFEFDERFVRGGPELAPLTMPTGRARREGRIFTFPTLPRGTFRGLPGLLADSLPDRFGSTLVDAWLAREGRDPAKVTPVDRLCYVGTRGMGALEYEPAMRTLDDVSESLDVGRLVALAKEIVARRGRLRANLRRSSEKALLEIMRVGSSAGGARAKAVIAYNRRTGEVRSGQVDGLDGFDYWIIKFDGVTNALLGDPLGYGRVEYAYHLMATEAGIAMSPCELLEESGRAHFLTKRFDRAKGEKLHMQTLCALAHLDYSAPGAAGYEQAFQALRRLKTSHEDMEELFRRVVFNVAARNQDDHTKNLSFLMERGGTWRLSPAYDVTFAYDPASRWMRAHQMSINGKVEGITGEDLLALARNANVKKAREIVDQVVAAVAAWPRHARAAGVPAARVRAIGKTHLLGLRFPGPRRRRSVRKRQRPS